MKGMDSSWYVSWMNVGFPVRTDQFVQGMVDQLQIGIVSRNILLLITYPRHSLQSDLRVPAKFHKSSSACDCTPVTQPSKLNGALVSNHNVVLCD